MTTRSPAAAAHSIICCVRRSPPCFMTLTFTMSAASRRMMSISEAGPVTLSSAMSGMLRARRIAARPGGGGVRLAWPDDGHRFGEGEALVEIYPEFHAVADRRANGGHAGDALRAGARHLDLRGGEPAAQPLDGFAGRLLGGQ